MFETFLKVLHMKVILGIFSNLNRKEHNRFYIIILFLSWLLVGVKNFLLLEVFAILEQTDGQINLKVEKFIHSKERDDFLQAGRSQGLAFSWLLIVGRP